MRGRQRMKKALFNLTSYTQSIYIYIEMILYKVIKYCASQLSDSKSILSSFSTLSHFLEDLKEDGHIKIRIL